MNLGVACTTGSSKADYKYCTVGGGRDNTASGLRATVGGGSSNTASGYSATVAGGRDNTVAKDYATVGGGDGNTANGDYATVGGGWHNTASGNYSFAAGRRANANHLETFVWADSSVDADFVSTGNNQFLIRASGGVGIGTADPLRDLHIASGGFAEIQLEKTGGTTNNWHISVGANALYFTETDVAQRMTLENGGNVGIGTTDPAHKLDVEGYVEAYGYYTGDIIFQKEKKKLWRMFEDEDDLYLENLKTGKTYRFVLQEVKKE